MTLQPDGIGGEALAGKLCPLKRVPAALDKPLCRAAAIEEGKHPFVGQAAVGEGGADPRKQLIRMKFHLGDDAPRLRSAVCPVMEARVEAGNVVRRPTRATLHQPGDVRVELCVSSVDADSVVPALGLQQVEQRGNGKGGIDAELLSGNRGPSVRGVPRQHLLEHILPTVGAVDVARPYGAPLL